MYNHLKKMGGIFVMMILSFFSLAIGLGLPILALIRRQQKGISSYIFASFVAYGVGSWLQYY